MINFQFFIVFVSALSLSRSYVSKYFYKFAVSIIINYEASLLETESTTTVRLNPKSNEKVYG